MRWLWLKCRIGAISMLFTLSRKRLISALCLAASGVILVFSRMGHGFWQCPVDQLFSSPCPGCGMTRSFICLFRADFELMFFYNAFTPYFLFIGLVALTGALFPVSWQKKVSHSIIKFEKKWAVNTLLLIGFVLYGFGRFFWVIV